MIDDPVTFERSAMCPGYADGCGGGAGNLYDIAAAAFRVVPDLERLSLRSTGPWSVEVRTPGFVMPPEAVAQLLQFGGSGLYCVLSFSAAIAD